MIIRKKKAIYKNKEGTVFIFNFNGEFICKVREVPKGVDKKTVKPVKTRYIRTTESLPIKFGLVIFDIFSCDYIPNQSFAIENESTYTEPLEIFINRIKQLQ